MRRRQARTPQNHALVASVAGVILLCGVVSVQTTQASQAFSHEQGMARMAAPQGSDAGATTAGDATWWSFWRAVRTLPHAYDAATATVLGAGDRGHASLDRALAEKRAEIERLRAQTASLKAEQARILELASVLQAASAPPIIRREDLTNTYLSKKGHSLVHSIVAERNQTQQRISIFRPLSKMMSDHRPLIELRRHATTAAADLGAADSENGASTVENTNMVVPFGVIY